MLFYKIISLCIEGASKCCCVDEDVVLLELLDVIFDVIHFFCECIHTSLLSYCVQGHHVVSFFLELMVKHLPFFLEGCNQFLAFRFRHQKLLSVFFRLLLNLHFAHQIVFILDLILYLGEVLWYLAECFLLQVVFILLLR